MSEAREESAAVPEETRRPPATLANGADAAEDDAAETPASPPSWREDWRVALAGGDERKARQLERYTSPEAWAKQAFDDRQRIRSGKAIAPEPPEEATDIELAQWRRQAGISGTLLCVEDTQELPRPPRLSAGAD
jgi:hypothetical protein